VDILSKVEFNLVRVPARHDRVERFREQDSRWLQQLLELPEYTFEPQTTPDALPMVAERSPSEPGPDSRLLFWQTCLDHYSLFGIDELEQGRTYTAPQFVNQFGSFSSFSYNYGGAKKLRADLEAIKTHLYVPMSA
ncbi:MAG TPA: hypothetical protein VLM37_11475, partial [Fibrobacteraceae bacterium]|nr:hypothetical protein [Fibrobacteraceae bacterium]